MAVREGEHDQEPDPATPRNPPHMAHSRKAPLVRNTDHGGGEGGGEIPTCRWWNFVCAVEEVGGARERTYLGSVATDPTRLFESSSGTGITWFICKHTKRGAGEL